MVTEDPAKKKGFFGKSALFGLAALASATSAEAAPRPASSPDLAEKTHVQREVFARWDAMIQNIHTLQQKKEKVDLSRVPSFTEAANMIEEMGRAGEDRSEVIHQLSLQNLKHPDNALLFASTSLIPALLDTKLNEKESGMLFNFMNFLPLVYGDAGRLQKVRMVNYIRSEVPELAERFYGSLGVRELLMINTVTAVPENLDSMLETNEYEIRDGSDTRTLFEDPSLANADSVAGMMPRASAEEPIAWAERVASVTRYLHFQDRQPTRDNVTAAETLLEATKGEWGDFKFMHDTVLYAANSNESRFMNPSEIQRIHEMSPDTQIFVGQKDASGKASSAEAATRLARSMESTKKPITVIFNMHGNDSGIYFGSYEETSSGAPVSQEVVGTPQDMADVFEARYRDDVVRQEAERNPDVIILLSCKSGSFVMRFVEEMKRRHLPVPVVIAGGEVGQTVLGLVGEPGADPTFEQHLLFSGNQTVRDLFDNEMWGIGSNPVVIVPEKANGDAVQIADRRSASEAVA